MGYTLVVLYFTYNGFRTGVYFESEIDRFRSTARGVAFFIVFLAFALPIEILSLVKDNYPTIKQYFKNKIQ